MKIRFRIIACLILFTQLLIVPNKISAAYTIDDQVEQKEFFDIETDLVSIEALKNGIIVRTPYGAFYESTQVIIALIYSQPMLRLRDIYQYGPSHFAKKDVVYGGVNETDKGSFRYTRFDHSICVWALTKLKGRSLEEQIAALLHDISHTSLSHVACFLYGKNQRTDKSWQDMVLKEFLIKHGIDVILSQYNIAFKDVLEKPYLDRIDYTLIGAWLAGYLSKSDMNNIAKNLNYNRNKKVWYFTSKACARKLVEVFLKQACNNNCAIWNTVVYTYTKLALERAFKLSIFVLREQKKIFLTRENFEYGLTDEEVWKMLTTATDKTIQTCMDIVINHETYLEAASPTASPTSEDKRHLSIIVPKFRELNPLVCTRKGKYTPILDLDYELRKKYNETKADVETGWQLDLQSFKKPIKAKVINGF